MDCEKCGAELTEGAEKCTDCGELVAAETEVETSPTEETTVTETVFEPDAALTADVGAKPSGGTKPIAMIVAVVLVIVAIVAGGAWFVQSRVAAADTPDAAVKAMLTAYAAYDAKGILDNATHASLATSDVAQFEKQATEAKTAAKNQASVKNVVIGKVTPDAKDKAKATVEVTAEWLDPSTGKYTKRTETLIAVKQDGKWLVQLF
jgi:uncharacterized membrane protein YvbJ